MVPSIGNKGHVRHEHHPRPGEEARRNGKKKYCGAKAFKVKWIWDPGNTCEHFGAAYRALEIDALEKRVEKEKEKEVG